MLKRLAPPHRYLAELKGLASTIAHILIYTLALQEAKDGSEIENIITRTSNREIRRVFE